MEPQEENSQEELGFAESFAEESDQGWYFDLPDGAWERQERKNRDLRQSVRQNVQSTEAAEAQKRDPFQKKKTPGAWESRGGSWTLNRGGGNLAEEPAWDDDNDDAPPAPAAGWAEPAEPRRDFLKLRPIRRYEDDEDEKEEPARAEGELPPPTLEEDAPGSMVDALRSWSTGRKKPDDGKPSRWDDMFAAKPGEGMMDSMKDWASGPPLLPVEEEDDDGPKDISELNPDLLKPFDWEDDEEAAIAATEAWKAKVLSDEAPAPPAPPASSSWGFSDDGDDEPAKQPTPLRPGWGADPGEDPAPSFRGDGAVSPASWDRDADNEDAPALRAWDPPAESARDERAAAPSWMDRRDDELDEAPAPKAHAGWADFGEPDVLEGDLPRARGAEEGKKKGLFGKLFGGKAKETQPKNSGPAWAEGGASSWTTGDDDEPADRPAPSWEATGAPFAPAGAASGWATADDEPAAERPAMDDDWDGWTAPAKQPRAAASDDEPGEALPVAELAANRFKFPTRQEWNDDWLEDPQSIGVAPAPAAAAEVVPFPREAMAPATWDTEAVEAPLSAEDAWAPVEQPEAPSDPLQAMVEDADELYGEVAEEPARSSVLWFEEPEEAAVPAPTMAPAEAPTGIDPILSVDADTERVRPHAGLVTENDGRGEELEPQAWVPGESTPEPPGPPGETAEDPWGSFIESATSEGELPFASPVTAETGAAVSWDSSIAPTADEAEVAEEPAAWEPPEWLRPSAEELVPDPEASADDPYPAFKLASWETAPIDEPDRGTTAFDYAAVDDAPINLQPAFLFEDAEDVPAGEPLAAAATEQVSSLTPTAAELPAWEADDEVPAAVAWMPARDDEDAPAGEVTTQAPSWEPRADAVTAAWEPSRDVGFDAADDATPTPWEPEATPQPVAAAWQVEPADEDDAPAAAWAVPPDDEEASNLDGSPAAWEPVAPATAAWAPAPADTGDADESFDATAAWEQEPPARAAAWMDADTREAAAPAPVPSWQVTPELESWAAGPAPAAEPPAAASWEQAPAPSGDPPVRRGPRTSLFSYEPEELFAELGGGPDDQPSFDPPAPMSAPEEDPWGAVVAASGYDEQGGDEAVYLGKKQETAAHRESALTSPSFALPVPGYADDGYVDTDDEQAEEPASPGTYAAQSWQDDDEDDVVLRAFEAHANTEIDEPPGADGADETFEPLFGKLAAELVDEVSAPVDQPFTAKAPSWVAPSALPPAKPSPPQQSRWDASGSGGKAYEAPAPRGWVETDPEEEARAAAAAPTPAAPFDEDDDFYDNEPSQLGVKIKDTRGRTLVRELVETGLLALLVFLAVRASFQNFKVDGSSMYPTLENGEFLIVNKLVYSEVDVDKLGRFLPFLDGGEDPKRHVFHPPERGDIVVLQDPSTPGVDLIKRVIGLPGESIEVIDGQVYINDRRLDEPYIKEKWRGNNPKVVIPAGEYFVMGDNRENSQDSRSSRVGFVPEDLIIGKAFVTYWPMGKFGFAPNGSPKVTEDVAPATRAEATEPAK